MYNFDEALNLVIDFVREHGYQGKIAVLNIERRECKVDIALLTPYGLFIVHETGQVEDNYETFS